MLIGRICRRLVATVKHPAYENQRIYMVRILNHREEATGESLVALDLVDSGVGDLVLTCSEGRWARQQFGEQAPVRSTIVAVLAGMDVDLP
jgi:microcompartment protein CcmK/EutM